MVQLYQVSTWLNAALSIGMAAVVLCSRPLTKLKVTWSLTCLSVALWNIGLGWMAGAETAPTALIACKLAAGSSAMIPIFLYHTSNSLLRRPQPKMMIALYAIGASLVFLTVADLMVHVGPIGPFRFYKQAKPLYFLYIAHIYVLFTAVATTLWRASNGAPNVYKTQYRLLASGTALAFLGGQTTFPYAFRVDVFPYGILAVPAYLIAVGYGMLRYEMLDFRVAAKKAATVVGIYLALFCLMVPILLPSLSVLKELERQQLIQLSILVSGVTAVLAVGPFLYTFLVRRGLWLRDHAATGLTHELKTPLANIKGAADFLTSAGLTPERQEEYIELISRNTERLEVFVGELLVLARIQTNDVRIEKSEVEMASILKETIDYVRPQAEKKGIAMKLNCQAPLLASVDRQKMAQAVSNLLSNAIKFSDTGIVEISCERRNGDITCTVTDQGRGVSRDALNKIFDRFFQCRRSDRGAGVGLAIAKAWVEAHGGRIWAESEGEGKGTTVSFTVPANGI